MINGTADLKVLKPVENTDFGRRNNIEQNPCHEYADRAKPLPIFSRQDSCPDSIQAVQPLVEIELSACP